MSPAAQRLVAGTGELNYRTAPIAGFLTGYIESLSVTPFEVRARRTPPCTSLPRGRRDRFLQRTGTPAHVFANGPP